MRSVVVKRLFDIVVSSTALIVLAPLMATVALMIWIDVGSPILFQQRRAGYKGSPFTLFKFRTMREDRGAEGLLLPDRDRLTKLGKFLRQYSLDELPQLWNVVVGDMSFVGPRPLLLDYLQRYSPEQARRHEVKPGLTGWAQVNGRNSLDWEERFRLDVWYVDNWSFGLDVKVIWKTFTEIFKGGRISHHGHATMPPFLGNDYSDL